MYDSHTSHKVWWRCDTLIYKVLEQMTLYSCYNLKLELRLHLGKGLREVKEVV